MTYTIPTILFFVLLSCAGGFGQGTFQGLTPGTSTKAEAERILGQPVKKLSETLHEYAPKSLRPAGSVGPLSSGKIYVQYRKDSRLIERIEVLCDKACTRIMRMVDPKQMPNPEATTFEDKGTENEKKLVFFGAPFFVVLKARIMIEEPPAHVQMSDEYRKEFGWTLGFYSLELYRATFPVQTAGDVSGSAAGTLWGPTDNQASLHGTTLIFYRGTTPEKCQADCGGNPKCKAFTLIRAGAYNANDPPMCYLISEVTGSAASSCCISAVKSKNER